MAASIEEAIERGLKKAFEKPINQLDGRCLNQVLNGIVNGELVAVVRCKDCKYWKDQSGTPKWLPCVEIQTSGMWFCADGERREAQPDG